MRALAVLLSFAGLLPFAAGVRAHALSKSGAWDVQIVIDDPRAQGKVSFRVDVSD